MNKYIFILTGILTGYILLLSCESDKRPEVKISDLPDSISFSTHILPVFENKCKQCHFGSTPPDLSPENAYIELTGGGYINNDIPEESKIYEAIITGGAMEQYAGDLDRAYILKWIQQGARDN